MKLNHQFSLWLLFIALCVGLVSLAWVQRAQAVKARFDAFANFTTPGLVALGQLKASSLQIRRDVDDLAAAVEAPAREAVEAQLRHDLARYHEWHTVYRGVALDAQDREFERTIQRVGEAWEQHAAAGSLKDVRGLEQGFVKSLDRAIGRQLKEAQAQKAALGRDAERAVRLSVWAAVILGLLAIGLGAFIAGTVARPLGRLGADMRRVGRGELSHRTKVRSKDEIGDLAGAFNRMAEDLEQTTVSKRYVDQIITSMADILIVADEAGRVQSVNAAAVRILGYSEQELLGRPLSALFVAGAVAPGVANAEAACQAKDGRSIPVLLSAAPMRGEGRQGLVCVALDMTDRKRAEAALEQARQQLAQSEKLAALGQFAAGVAHEVKNPLAIIQGGVEFLGLKAADEDTRQTVRMIEESVTRADTIIRDLLKFARPSAQKREAVAPEELVRGTINLLTYGGALKQVQVKTRIDAALARLEVDKSQIQQVLLNVMMNSVDAMPGGGSLTVSAGATMLDGGRAGCAIAVADTGEGIAPEHLAKMFEPFFTTKRDKKGTGLGLSVSKTIVESHGGTMRIASEPGKGTVVTLVLPATGGQA